MKSLVLLAVLCVGVVHSAKAQSACDYPHTFCNGSNAEAKSSHDQEEGHDDQNH